MQRQLIDGVPYFVDAANKLYTWTPDTSPTPIGSYNPTTKTVLFESNHLAGLTDSLATWRSSQQPRSRKPANE